MVLICERCHVRIGLERRVLVCPYCKRDTTWYEPLTRYDQQELKLLKIRPDQD